MKIFIIHSVENKELAEAWERLLKACDPNAEIFFSSDSKPEGGMIAGDWRRQLHERIERSDALICLLTPASAERPWITYELGYALALKGDKCIYPITYWLIDRLIPDPAKGLELFNGKDKDKVFKALTLVFPDRELKDKNNINKILDEYFEEINKIENRFDPQLFTDRFHNYELAKRLEGKWWLMWKIENEESWKHPVKIQSLPTRLRIAIPISKVSNMETALEGVVSPKSYIALTWWAGGQKVKEPEEEKVAKALCGTAVLELADDLRTAEGNWQGYAAWYYKKGIEFREGKICISRDEDDECFSR